MHVRGEGLFQNVVFSVFLGIHSHRLSFQKTEKIDRRSLKLVFRLAVLCKISRFIYQIIREKLS